jgi:DNA-binding response OmpR family regulator
MRVLVVEGDVIVADSFASGLRRHGYDAERVETGRAALKAYSKVDLVLLDLELPDVDGLEVCRAIRAEGDTPIIAVTDSDNELDRVLGLQAGSDDCVRKSACLGQRHGFRELMARIEAVMRRVHPGSSIARAIRCGPLSVDPNTREVCLYGRLVRLTRKEFDLLYLLATNSHRIVPRRQIMSEVWDEDYMTSSRTLDMHVSSLRAKLGASSWIRTVRGVGFRIGDV